MLSFIIATLLWLPLPAGAQSGPSTVTILHFNDVYEITPVDGGKAGGLARLARFRAEMKTRHPELITTLGGDVVSPSALGTARVNGERLAGKQMVAVLNALGLDWRRSGTTSSTPGQRPTPHWTAASPPSGTVRPPHGADH